MIHRRAALAISLILFVHGTSFAATVTMLQFGSFETRAEAETRATEVKQKHAGVIGAMSVTIREVKLPPDNLIVYRTQAGPVVNKVTAQSICSQLASNGDECYVVETAMLDTGKAVAGAAAETVATGKNAPANVTTPVVSGIPARDPRSVAALAGITTAPTIGRDSSEGSAKTALAPLSEAAALPEAAVAPASSPELQAALDRAAANEDSLAASVTPLPANPVANAKRSFWSRLNPFSESQPTAKASSASAQEIPPSALPAPVTNVTENVLPVVPSTPTTEPLPLSPANRQVAAEIPVAAVMEPPAPASVRAPVVQTEISTPMVLAPSPVDAAPFLLPPPPAPLKGFSPASPSTSVVPFARGPEPTGAIIAAPIPVTSASLQPLRNGNVNVGEAQRVPLTQAVTPPVAVMPITPSNSPVMSLSPSATLGQKTIWAQMGPFTDTQEALAFWDSYRQIHPDFPVVRVRVTSSLLAQRHGDDGKWLRIGPFAREGFVSSLCSGLVNADGEPLRAGMRCGRVVDLGVASSAERMPGYLPGSRYSR